MHGRFDSPALACVLRYQAVSGCRVSCRKPVPTSAGTNATTTESETGMGGDREGVAKDSRKDHDHGHILPPDPREWPMLHRKHLPDWLVYVLVSLDDSILWAWAREVGI